MNYLTKEKYIELTKGYLSKNWERARQRWPYHKFVRDMLIRINPDIILEAGSMGVKLCEQSETIDYSESGWEKFYTPTYDHDLRELPWPVGKYDVFVALRVFHHLIDKPGDYIHEMQRISKMAIIALNEPAYKIYNKARKPDNIKQIGGTIILTYGFH